MEREKDKFADSVFLNPTASWSKIYPPLVEHLKLQCRMNVKTKAVELRTSRHTTDVGALQKGEDFVRAFALGFDTEDAIALLRLDDLYIETFEVKDVKTLNGDHLARAIGRIAGKDGKTKFAIESKWNFQEPPKTSHKIAECMREPVEGRAIPAPTRTGSRLYYSSSYANLCRVLDASRTRVVLADSKIHILGGFKNIQIARESIVSLVRRQTLIVDLSALTNCVIRSSVSSQARCTTD